MVTIAVAAIVAVMAVPSYTAIIDRNRLRNIGEQVRSDLALARTEAIKRSRTVVVSFTADDGAGGWCYGVNLDTACDCTVTNVTDADFCNLDVDSGGTAIRQVVSSSEHPRITMKAADPSPFGGGGGDVTFSAVRQTVVAGSVAFTSDANQEVRVVASGMGRLRLCSPSGTTHLMYFPEC